jgi:hypothetical protein
MPTWVGPRALAGAAEAGIRNAGRRADTPHTLQAQAAGTRMGRRRRRPRSFGTHLEFAELPIRAQVDNVAVHLRANLASGALPASPLDGPGPQTRQNCKTKNFNNIRWCSRDLVDRFSSALVELLRAAHLGTLADVP